MPMVNHPTAATYYPPSEFQERIMSLRGDRRLFLKTSGSLMAGAVVGGVPHALFAAGTVKDASSAQQLGWRLACCAYSFNHLTFYETIDKVASLQLKTLVGFNWQKLSPRTLDAIFSENMSTADRRETRKRLSDTGIQLACCYCRDLNKEAPCRRLFDFAREMGIETIDGEPPRAAFDMLEKLADEYHINLAIHNHARPSPYWKPDALMEVFRGRSKRIGACCDTGHWARSGLKPVETLQTLQGRILTLDLKDVDERGVCVPFGTGKGDIGGILKELHQQRFRGVFGIEYDEQPANIEMDVAQCAAYFNKMAQQMAAKRPNQGDAHVSKGR
jgi:sugar phosphate isomerase/epimerase